MQDLPVDTQRGLELIRELDERQLALNDELERLQPVTTPGGRCLPVRARTRQNAAA